MKWFILVLFCLFTLLNVGEVYAKDVCYKKSNITTQTNFQNVKASWYAKGLKNPEALTTACWCDFPKGTRFKVSYRNNFVVVTCNDRGHFREMERLLDLSKGAFESLAPLKFGVIKVNVKVLK